MMPSTPDIPMCILYMYRTVTLHLNYQMHTLAILKTQGEAENENHFPEAQAGKGNIFPFC